MPAFWAWRALLGPVKIWAAAGIDDATLNATSRMRDGIRFIMCP
jgi:hypothetical protein